MRRNVFEKLEREKAVEYRARLVGLLDNDGFKLFLAENAVRARKMRGEVMPIVNDDFATLNMHNRRLHQAEAIEEVLEWVQNAIDQCDSIVEGKCK